jgi:TonB family protein
MNRFGAVAFVVAMAVAGPAAAQFETSAPQGPLTAAKDLYASARYDEALSVLNGLRLGQAVDRKSIEQVRLLCLLALGRTAEAETAIAAVVSADPSYRPVEAEAAPRVRTLFSDVRKRLLPEITTSRYQSAKAVYDRKEWAAAEEQFRTVLALIDDPDTGGRLSDLRVLTVGFLELSARAAAPPPPPVVEARPVAAGPLPGAAAPAAMAGPAGPVPGKIYSADDPVVKPPVVVRQEIPTVPQPLIALAKPRGLLELVIDEQGRVVNMTMRQSIHPTYDMQVLTAARDWKYQPARFNGQPVPFRRLISFAVKK